MNKYKKSAGSIYFLIISIMIISSVSCSGDKNIAENTNDSKTAVLENNESESDYSGIYRLADADKCNIEITINNDNSNYTISGTGVKSSGKLSVVKNDTETYLNFTGTKRGSDNVPIEGVWSDGKIIIQNYGNSMNQYICFKSCDEKFLEFVKAD